MVAVRILPVLNYKKDEAGTEGADTGLNDAEAVPEIFTIEKSSPEEAILCARCRHEITSKRQRISVHGAYEHTFVNPAGHIFHLGCYREATGCLPTGELTTEFTWFKGYAWNYALCAACFSHLGWTFRAGDGHGFFGLILDKLIFY